MRVLAKAAFTPTARALEQALLEAMFWQSSFRHSGAIIAHYQKRERELRMSSYPEVIHTRISPNVDKTPRPPPKSFADFQNEVNGSSPDGTKGTFIPPAKTSEAPLPSKDEQRLGILEQRLEILEGMTEELAEAATKPTTSHSSSIDALVRLAVVEEIMPPAAALLAIAWQLGIVDRPKRSTASANFLTPLSAPPAPPARALPAPMPPTHAPAPKSRRTKSRSSTPVAEEKPYSEKTRVTEQEFNAQKRSRAAVAATMGELGLSQSEVATLANVSQSMLSRWLRGGTVLDPQFYRSVEKAVNKAK